jgi:HSP20 family protein
MTRNNSRRNPFGVILSEMSSVGDEFAALCNRLSTQEAAQAAPFPLNVWHDENAIYVEGDLPGVKADTLEVTVTGGDRLSIRAERPAPEKTDGVTWLRAERSAGAFARVIGLPVLVDADKVEAGYTNGVLKVTLPKIAAVKPRTVPVKVAQ